MASASIILENIDERFYMCCACFKHYMRHPIQLPCPHSYCNDCLVKLITRRHDVINCAICKGFSMNTIVEVVQVHKSLQDDQIRTCFGCSKDIKSSAYCFKCRNYLCNDCLWLHMTNNTLQNHKPRVLALRDLERSKFTLQELVTLKDELKCQEHPNNLSNLCYKICPNLPISRDECNEELHEIIAELKEISFRNFEEQVQNLRTKHQEGLETLEAKRTHNLKECHLSENEIKNILKLKLTNRNKQMEQKIDQIGDENTKQNIRDIVETKTELRKMKEKQDKEEVKVTNEENISTHKFEELQRAVNLEKNKKLETIRSMFQPVDSTVKRYENLSQIGSSILASTDNWAILQNVEDICLAAEPLCQEMKRAVLENILEVKSSDLPFVTVANDSDIVKGLRVNGITCTGSGTIVISGAAPGGKAHITVINNQGAVIKQQMIQPSGNTLLPQCYIAPFKESKVVVACNPHEIGLFDVCSGLFTKYVILSDAIPIWSKFMYVRCIATDDTNNRIFVGCFKHRNVYVFDDHLNLCQTLKLPEDIKWPRDITVSKGQLIICGLIENMACAVDMKGKLLYQFSQPDGCEFPYSVCTDKKGFIFILWAEKLEDSVQHCILTQYSEDGRQLLTQRSLYQDVPGWITVVETNQTKKLVMGTSPAFKMHITTLYSGWDSTSKHYVSTYGSV